MGIRTSSSTTIVTLTLAIVAACEIPLVDGGDPQNPLPDEVADAGTGEDLDSCRRAPPSVGRAPLRLLTNRELAQTISDLFGHVPSSIATLPPENESMGFGNGEAHGVSPIVVDGFLRIAEDTAAVFVEAPNLVARMGCDPLVDSETNCGEIFLSTFLTRAFRRPVRVDEFSTFKTLFETASIDTTFVDATRLVVTAALSSPQFLYRIEEGLPDDDGDDIVQPTGHEMASRLSYFLWDSLPDAALLDDAANGRLATEEGVREVAHRMIDDERAHLMVRDFHRQWLHLDGLTNITKEPDDNGLVDNSFGIRLRHSVDHFVDDVYFGNQSTVEALFSSPVMSVDGVLAALYDVSSPIPPSTTVVFPADERAGLLTHPAMLALLANPDQSSPIRRGVFVREKILCEILEPPPDDVPIQPPDPDPSLTTRERFAVHTENPMCASCHVLIDPIGFGFEQYDGLGRFRTVENGLVVDASGDVQHTWSDDQALEGAFTGAVELSHRLGRAAQVKACLSKQWFRYGVGRPEGPADACTLDAIADKYEHASDDVPFTFKDLLVEVCASNAFRFRPRQRTEAPLPTTADPTTSDESTP